MHIYGMKCLRMDIKPWWNKQILDLIFGCIWKSSFDLQVLAFLKWFSFGGDIHTKQKYVSILEQDLVGSLQELFSKSKP
jgi:hypothetical protein